MFRWREENFLLAPTYQALPPAPVRTFTDNIVIIKALALELTFWMKLMIMTEKAMATHSSTLAWKIPWTEEPGGLQSMGLLRVGHN